jgi:hypothetical protein
MEKFMDIREIKSFVSVLPEIKSNPPKKEQEKISNIQNVISDKVEISSPNPKWQNDILIDVINKLENSKQLDDSHPLDRMENSPIETFEEAIFELKFLQDKKYFSQFGPAQANLSPESVLSLFVEA